MRKAVCHILFGLITVPAIAQCTFPNRVEIGNLSPSIPNSDRDLGENPNAYYSPYVENFHPIGWSSDGKVAYMIWGERLESCHFGLVVYDAVRDTVCAKWFEDMSGSNILDQQQIPGFWKRDQDSIQYYLDRYHIVCTLKCDYRNFPVTTTNTTYNIEFGIQASTSDPDRIYSSLSGNCIISSKQGEDTISFVWKDFFALDIQPAGIWFSPDGKYSIIIGYTETMNSEKNENPHSYLYFVRTLPLKNK